MDGSVKPSLDDMQFSLDSAFGDILPVYAELNEPEPTVTNDRKPPLGFKFVKVHQEDGTTATIQRNLSPKVLCRKGHGSQDSNASDASSRSAHKSVIVRDSQGRFIKVTTPLHPVDEGSKTLRSEAFCPAPTPSPIAVPVPVLVPAPAPASASESGHPERPLSVRSSISRSRGSRDTMRTTMSVVDDALKEQETYQRESGGLEHRSTPLEDVYSESEYDESEYDESEYDENDDNQYVHEARVALLGSLLPPGHIDAPPSRPPSAYHTQRKLSYASIYQGHAGRKSSTVPAYQRKSTAERHWSKSWEMESSQTQRQIMQEVRLRSWRAHLAGSCFYLMATVSTLLPLAFLVLSILMEFMNGKEVSSSWGRMKEVIGAGVSIWPITFVAVVAQCLKSWAFCKMGRADGGTHKRHLMLRRLDIICIAIFLVLCLSIIGSQALEHVYGIALKTNQDQVDVFYLDQTGSNQIWGPQSVDQMSTTKRADFVDMVAAYYVGNLAPGPSGTDNLTDRFSRPLINFENSDALVSGFGIPIALPTSIVASRSTNDEAALAEAPLESVAFSVVTSYFNFTCGEWQSGLDKSNSTVMSYSDSQTLGLSMRVNGSTSASQVRFASMNTSPSNSSNNGSPVYSVIDCRYDQVFANRSVECVRDRQSGSTTCAQSGSPQRLDDLTGLVGTQLGDFASEFVKLGNPSTVYGLSTASERYIQNSGKVGALSATSPMNLGSSTSPEDFAKSFGYLFNTWVSLGYCPQCYSVTDIGTMNHEGLNAYYRTVSSARKLSGDQVFATSPGWLIVFIVSAAVLFVAGITSVVVDSMTIAPWKTKRPQRPLARGASNRTGTSGSIRLMMLDLHADAGAGRS